MIGRSVLYWIAAAVLICCGRNEQAASTAPPLPKEIIDLGTLIAEETPRQFWGNRFLRDMGFEEPNSFRVIHWQYGPVSGSNAYFTLFNHGGPHVDAPNHVGVGPGLDAYPIDAFAGPLKVIDVSHLDPGRTVTVDTLKSQPISAGDVVVIYTGYTAPTSDTDLPETITLTYPAAEFLADIPIRAFGTDAFSVASITDQSPVESDNEVVQTVPIHHALLSRGIPAYEQLVNVSRLLGRQNMYFVGVPLNIKDADGMLVRPVALIY